MKKTKAGLPLLETFQESPRVSVKLKGLWEMNCFHNKMNFF